MLRSKGLTEKIVLLGIDGMDPTYSRRMVDEGKMPNLKKLIEKGWIIHKPSENGQQGEIIVDYDAIYKSAERDIENTPSPDNEYTPSNSEYTSSGVIENTHNNIEKIISSNNINYNNIKNPKVSECSDKLGNFVF